MMKEGTVPVPPAPALSDNDIVPVLGLSYLGGAIVTGVKLLLSV